MDGSRTLGVSQSRTAGDTSPEQQCVVGRTTTNKCPTRPREAPYKVTAKIAPFWAHSPKFSATKARVQIRADNSEWVRLVVIFWRLLRHKELWRRLSSMDIFARYEISKSVVLRCSQEPNEGIQHLHGSAEDILGTQFQSTHHCGAVRSL